MITRELIYKCMRNPDAVAELNTEELRRLVMLYPYTEPLRYIYMRKLFVDNDLSFDHELTANALWISDYTHFYNYVAHVAPPIIPELEFSIATAPRDYMSMSDDQRESLRSLAEKLHQARLAQLEQRAKAVATPAPQPIDEEAVAQKVQDLIKGQKYAQALQLLEKIDLHNSKKNAYFALQIKYLKTIVKK